MRNTLRLLVSVAILGALFHRVGIGEVADVLGQAQPIWLAIAAALYALGQLVSALRWRGLASSVGFMRPLSSYVRVYFTSMFFGLSIPSTLGTDGARTLALGGHPPGRARALSTVVFDRALGLITLVAVAVAALLLGPGGDLPGALTVAILTLGTLLVLLWFLAPRLARRLPPERRLRTLIENDLAPFFANRRLLGTSILLSLTVHGVQILAQKCLIDALGLAVPLGFVAIFHPLVVLAAAVPITIGGFGLREAAYAYLLPLVGIAPDDAIALALLWWAVGAAWGLVGGLLLWGNRPGDRPPPTP